MKRTFLSILILMLALAANTVGASGMYRWSVQVRGYISSETGKEPMAFLWVPVGCDTVRAVVFAQQNMAEETLYKMPAFQREMKRLAVGLIWVAPAFTNTWNPAEGCQSRFDKILTALAYQSGHSELLRVPIVPLGHSAQASMPWNFAAWNSQRTLCVISLHGDAPRTNLCGYGTANVEWGRTRNIDGIPGLMIEGEYEWWEARVLPALAFRMMYPESCISFLCDAGSGHFDCSEPTALYIAKFIEKSLQTCLLPDGTLRRLNPRDGWLACRYNADLAANDGDGSCPPFAIARRPEPAPFAQYKGDRHDAFWYFDEEMAQLTESRYAATHGKRQQFVGIEYNGRLIPYNPKSQGGMVLDLRNETSVKTITLKAVYTDSTHTVPSSHHGVAKPHMDFICGPAQKVNDATFRIIPYEAGMDNPKRSHTVWLCAVAEGDETYKGAVQPIEIRLPTGSNFSE